MHVCSGGVRMPRLPFAQPPLPPASIKRAGREKLQHPISSHTNAHKKRRNIAGPASLGVLCQDLWGGFLLPTTANMQVSRRWPKNTPLYVDIGLHRSQVPAPLYPNPPSLHMPRHPSSLLGTWEPSTLQRRFGPNFSSSKPHPSSPTAFNTPGTLHFLPLSTTTRGILMLELA